MWKTKELQYHNAVEESSTLLNVISSMGIVAVIRVLFFAIVVEMEYDMVLTLYR